MSKKPNDKTQATPPDELSFEQAMERLESIVDRVERGEIGLEDALKEYETGMTLIKRCKDVLAKAQQRVEELSREALRNADND